MNKCMPLFFSFVLFFTGVISVYCDPAEHDNADTGQNELTPRTFFMPIASYAFISLGNIHAHNAVGGLALYRFNPNERDKLFSISLIYTPHILIDTAPDFPALYHTASLSITQKISRHTISGTFIAMTDKPVYGGLRTFMGMAGYSYDLINGAHFSMDLGARLAVMDIGVTLDNGTPWLLWPIPSVRLAWNYEWITFGLMPGAWATIAPKFPVSLNFKTGSQTYDVSLWYRYFRNGNPSAEIMGIGIGVKKDLSTVIRSDGWKYDIYYDALYGSVRLLRLFEISGGWIFDGKEGYKEINWETLFESVGYSDASMYSGNTGKGFFVSISVRANL